MGRLSRAAAAAAEAIPLAEAIGTSAIAGIAEHRYSARRRIQYLRSQASPIRPEDIPRSMRGARLLFLGPLAGEVDPAMLSEVRAATTVAAAQGWLRRIEPDGKVREGGVDGLDFKGLEGIQGLVLSEEDLAGKRVPDAWRRAFKNIIVTRSREGLNLYREGECSSLGVFPAIERDATGAGDALAAAFLIRFGETHDVVAAVRFASTLASFVVEAPGLGGIPSREQVEQRLRENPEIALTPCL